MKGEVADALTGFRHQYDYGADPAEVLRDLLDVTHLVTRTKAAGAEASAHGPSGTADAEAAQRLAEHLPLPALTRTWSLLMTALKETQAAPDPAAAAEIGLIRLAYASQLPTPAEVIAGAPAPTASQPMEAPGKPEPPRAAAPAAAESQPEPTPPPTELAPEPEDVLPTSLGAIAAMAGERGDLILKHDIEQRMRLVSFDGTRIVIALTDDADPGIPARLQSALVGWTGAAWDVEIGSATAAEPTLKDARDAAIHNHPLVKEALRTFPGATITEIRPLGGKEPSR